MKFRLVLDNGCGVEFPLDECILECEDDTMIRETVVNAMAQAQWTLAIGDSIHIVELN